LAPIQEVSDHVDVEVRKGRIRVFYLDSPSVDVDFADVAAFSRAMSIAKESKEYQAWLVAQGLA
jgi:hypothetical protein